MTSLLQDYRKAVVSAFGDVDNALVAIRETTNKVRLQRDVVSASRRAFQLSEQQLKAGTADFVTVLNTQLTLFQAEDALWQASSRGYWRSSAFIRRWEAAGSRKWRSRSMLFKPDTTEADDAVGGRTGARWLRRSVWTVIALAVIGGLGYLGWVSHEKQAASRVRPDLAVPVLAAVPRVQDVPVYLDGVGTVRALNNVLVRSQVDGKLISVNFVEGQDVKKGDVLGEIDPAIYKAQYDQAVAKKAQDEAQLAKCGSI